MSEMPRRLAAMAAVASVVMLACTEDPLGNLDAETAPGASSPTREFRLSAADLPAWRDTTVSGFTLRSTAGFVLLSDQSTFRSRSLNSINVPDTLTTLADTLPVERFEDASIRIAIDTVNSVFAGFPLMVRLISLAEGFEPDEASWTQAAEGRPWTMPGGDLGAELSSAEMMEVSDSLIFEFQVPLDSLLKSWQAQDGDPGFALVLEGPGSRIQIRALALRIEALLEGREVPIEQELVTDVRTFITDPDPPPAGLALRVAGLPASRFYVTFEPPDSLDGIPLLGSAVNHAELVFHPLPPPTEPYVMERNVAVRPVTLLADPFEFGAKTPIGSTPATFTLLEPDSLAIGEPFRVDVTALVAGALFVEADSIGQVKVGLRAEPDGQAVGFWEFGSVEAGAGLRPELVLVLTPRPTFGVP
jgi:hypothetical protein